MTGEYLRTQAARDIPLLARRIAQGRVESVLVFSRKEIRATQLLPISYPNPIPNTTSTLNKTKQIILHYLVHNKGINLVFLSLLGRAEHLHRTRSGAVPYAIGSNVPPTPNRNRIGTSARRVRKI
jgi:hypothetical protein